MEINTQIKDPSWTQVSISSWLRLRLYTHNAQPPKCQCFRLYQKCINAAEIVCCTKSRWENYDTHILLFECRKFSRTPPHVFFSRFIVGYYCSPFTSFSPARLISLLRSGRRSGRVGRLLVGSADAIVSFISSNLNRKSKHRDCYACVKLLSRETYVYVRG